MAFGLAYNGKWCCAITVGGTTLVNMFTPPGGNFLDSVTAAAWGAASISTGQTATALLIQTAI